MLMMIAMMMMMKSVYIHFVKRSLEKLSRIFVVFVSVYYRAHFDRNVQDAQNITTNYYWAVYAHTHFNKLDV